jgi:hypothetical protein
MTVTDVDTLITDAHEALSAATQKEVGALPYREYCLGLVEAFEALERAYEVAQRELAPPARSALFWALLDGQLAARGNAAEYRREARR